MDGRAKVATGGLLAGGAAAAVVVALTISNSAVLADAAGAATGVPAVRVTGSSALPTMAPTQSPSAALSTSPAQSTTETVPAPDPQDVAAPVKTFPSAAPIAPAPVASAAPAASSAPAAPAASGAPSAATPPEPTPISDASKRQVEVEVLASGSLKKAYAWARAHGWSTARTESWIADLRHKLTVAEKFSPPTPAAAGTTSGRADIPSGSKKDRSSGSPVGD